MENKFKLDIFVTETGEKVVTVKDLVRVVEEMEKEHMPVGKLNTLILAELL